MGNRYKLRTWKYSKIQWYCVIRIKEHTAGNSLEEVLGEDSQIHFGKFSNGIEFKGSHSSAPAKTHMYIEKMI